MSDSSSALTVLRCRRCGAELNICVPASVGVPDELRCPHAQHGGVKKDASGQMMCEKCGCPWRIDGESLGGAVEEELLRAPREWIRLGHVIVTVG